MMPVQWHFSEISFHVRPVAIMSDVEAEGRGVWTEGMDGGSTNLVKHPVVSRFC